MKQILPPFSQKRGNTRGASLPLDDPRGNAISLPLHRRGNERGLITLIRYRYETPIDEPLARELFAFWEEIFGPEDPDIPIGVFLGDEAEHNRHVVLAERDRDVLVGTCGIMTPRANPEFAGIGEVAHTTGVPGTRHRKPPLQSSH